MVNPNIREFYRDTSRYRTLGEQYNNLGNITQGSSGIWPGQDGIGWDADGNRAYKRFATVEDGIAAQAYLIERYLFQNGDVTFHDIISRYAPSSDGNNVPAYVGHVADRVDRIARQLGYTGPTINGRTNLRELLENPAHRDAVLAATIKAMNEVEVGQDTSDRLAPASTILAAIRSRYANAGGTAHEAFQRYSRAIGRDPGIRRPSRRRGSSDTEGDAETSDEPWRQPTDGDIDDVMHNMFSFFAMLLVSLFVGPERAAEMFGGQQDAPTAPAPSTGTTQWPRVAVDLNGDGTVNDQDFNLVARVMGDQPQLFARMDMNRDGQFTQVDLDDIRTALATANVSLATDATPEAVLTAYASHLRQQATQPTP